ncbi:MAG: DUF3592 domain-containing protein [Ruminococcus sp.]|nr:DUF3592 domain-containing protein [Ruminococcus sp.]
MGVKGSPKIVGFIFAFVAVIVIILGVWVSVNTKQLQKRCTDTVMAEIVENIKVKSRTKTKHGHRTVTTYKPVFDFTYNGQNYRIKSNSSHKPALFDVGEKTEIKINPSDPSETYIPADKSADYAGIICIAVGAVFLVVGILVIIKLR